MQRTSSRDTATWLALTFCLSALAVLGVAAYFLADTQRDQRADLRERFADRTEVAGALLDSLFRVAYAGTARDAARELGSRRLSRAALDRRAREGASAWVAVVDGEGRVLGASGRLSAPDRERLGTAPAFVRRAFTSAGYGLGEARGDVIETAVGFRAATGQRALVTAGPLSVFEGFLSGTLAPLSAGRTARAAVIDGDGRIISAVENRRRIVIRDPVRAQVLRDATGMIEVGGVERFFTADTLAQSDWRLAASVPRSELYASSGGVGRWLPWVFLLLGAASLVGVALLVVRLLRTRTALRRANSDLARSNEELARSNADLEQFAYVASHDLSEPLRSVAGFSQLIASRYTGQLDPEADVYISQMSVGVERMQQLIDDLLVYSRAGRDPMSLVPVPLGEVLDEVLAAIDPLVAERSARVAAGELPTVAGERGQLRQVLQNLLVNAIKFTAPGVTPQVAIDAAREGDRWRVSVTDNGRGIDPAQREAVFKMFGRLHRDEAYPGTGIGLALVKRIVERHGGRVWIEDAPAGGSVFSFTLPQTAGLRARPEPVKVPA